MQYQVSESLLNSCIILSTNNFQFSTYFYKSTKNFSDFNNLDVNIQPHSPSQNSTPLHHKPRCDDCSLFSLYYSPLYSPLLQIQKEQVIISLIRLPAPIPFHFYSLPNSPHNNFTLCAYGITEKSMESAIFSSISSLTSKVLV